MTQDGARTSASSIPGAARVARVRRPAFQSVLMGVTALLHGAAGLAFWGAGEAVGVPLPWVGAAIAATTLAYAFRPIVLDTFPDQPRSRWRVLLVEQPYFAHWCALVLTLVSLPVGVAVWTVQALLHSSSNISITSWAWQAYLAGLALSVWGVFVRRHFVRVRRKTVQVDGLDPAFEGFRIVQLSDLHIGSFATPDAARGWVQLANEQGADLAVVTGDLVSGGVDFHREIAEVVAGLRAPAGVAAIPGNHDYFGDGEPLFGLLRERGVRLLRNDSFVVERAGARLTIAGVDDTWTRRTDLGRALRDREPGVPVVLLAHDPALFPRAVKARVALVLSGHTHGGQIAVPFLARWLNLSAWTHRYQLGVYREGESTLVVSGGLGTTGPPLRLGVAPEVVVIELTSGVRPPV